MTMNELKIKHPALTNEEWTMLRQDVRRLIQARGDAVTEDLMIAEMDDALSSLYLDYDGPRLDTHPAWR